MERSCGRASGQTPGARASAGEGGEDFRRLSGHRACLSHRGKALRRPTARRPVATLAGLPPLRERSLSPTHLHCSDEVVSGVSRIIVRHGGQLSEAGAGAIRSQTRLTRRVGCAKSRCGKPANALSVSCLAMVCLCHCVSRDGLGERKPHDGFAGVLPVAFLVVRGLGSGPGGRPVRLADLPLFASPTPAPLRGRDGVLLWGGRRRRLRSSRLPHGHPDAAKRHSLGASENRPLDGARVCRRSTLSSASSAFAFSSRCAPAGLAVRQCGI